MSIFQKAGGIAMKVGYARVSTTAQDHAIQIEALKTAGCERIFSEKRSGKSVDGRPEFKRLLRALNPGDTVVVTRLDRLARSSRDLQNIVHDLQEAGCGFTSLAEPWCDTTSPAGKLLVTILGGISEFERSLILARTEAGNPQGARARQEVRTALRSRCRSEAQDRRALCRRRDHGRAGARV
jgi:DNA invertase Pin-like site-specific DNA recombinase